MTFTTRTALVSAFLFTGIAVIACGSDDDDDGSSSGNATASGGASGNGSSGFGSSGVPGGDGGASSGASGQSSGSSGSEGCNTTTKKAEKIPLDMVIGLDTSFSMDFDDKWINVREALKSFVGNPNYSDLGVGLQFFPLRKQCNVDDYTNLAVPLALQPDARAPINEQLAAQKMAGGTPMVPLLQGLTGYLAKNAKPGHKPVIVLATDGFPDDTCLSTEDGATANTFDNAVKIAKTAFEGNPSIATFVIGVGGELDALNDIAKAGGSDKASLVNDVANARTEFLKALETIRKVAIPCDYPVPSDINPAETNVTYTTEAGGTRQMVYTGNASGCAKAPNGEGWYFDDEKAPKKVILCKAVCDAVNEKDGSSVDLLFGCPRNDVK